MTIAPAQPMICRAPSEEDAARLLRTLVSIPSLSGAEGECAAALVASMRNYGFEAMIDASGSAVGVVGDPSPGAKEVVLLGHIDTVPGDIPVREEGDLLFGRGTVDAKGPLAAFTVAAARATLPPGVRVRVIGAVEEEAATSKGARFAATAYHADACIIGEPSGAEGVTLGYKGRLIATLTVKSSSSHSAGPDPTASELAFEIWLRVSAGAAAIRPESARIFERVQARLRAIRSESDGLSDRAMLVIGFRIPPGVNPRQLEDLCREAGGLRSVEASWEFTGHEIAHVSDRSNLAARALTAGIRAEGLTPVPKLKTGTSDMNVVGPIWNCPIAAYGPGDSSLDHTPNEHISMTEFHASARVLQRAIETMALELTR